MTFLNENIDRKWHVCGFHVKYLALAMILFVDVPSSILVHILDDTPIYARYMVLTVFLDATFIFGIWFSKDYLLLPNILHQIFDLTDVPFILYDVIKSMLSGDSSITDYSLVEIFLILFGLSYYCIMLYTSIKCFLYISSLGEDEEEFNKKSATIA